MIALVRLVRPPPLTPAAMERIARSGACGVEAAKKKALR